MDIKQCEEMDMPQPDFLLCCNNICNCMINGMKISLSELNIPMILIDIPYKNDYDTDDVTVKYVQAQFDDAIKQLEKVTGKVFSEEKGL